MVPCSYKICLIIHKGTLFYQCLEMKITAMIDVGVGFLVT